MNTQTCIKYLDYVSLECDKRLKDGQVSDDELVNLIVEFQRFQEKIQQSELPDEIKEKVLAIKLNYSMKGVARSQWFLIAAFLSFGSWAIIMHFRKQSKRKQALNLLKFDASRLASFLRLNY